MDEDDEQTTSSKNDINTTIIAAAPNELLQQNNQEKMQIECPFIENSFKPSDEILNHDRESSVHALINDSKIGYPQLNMDLNFDASFH